MKLTGGINLNAHDPLILKLRAENQRVPINYTSNKHHSPTKALEFTGPFRKNENQS
jgi:hypothetical protein